MTDMPQAAQTGALTNPCTKIRDVADFHVHWPELRPIAMDLSGNRALTQTEQDILTWMIALLDRIGPQDLESGDF